MSKPVQFLQSRQEVGAPVSPPFPCQCNSGGRWARKQNKTKLLKA